MREQILVLCKELKSFESWVMLNIDGVDKKYTRDKLVVGNCEFIPFTEYMDCGNLRRLDIHSYIRLNGYFDVPTMNRIRGCLRGEV